MKRKLLIFTGALLMLSALAGLSLAHHSTADNHTDNHDHHEDDFVDKLWYGFNNFSRCGRNDLHNQTEHCFPNFSQPFFPQPFQSRQRNDWIRTPDVRPYYQTAVRPVATVAPVRYTEPRVIEPRRVVQPQPQPIYVQPEPQSVNYASIRSERVGNRINFYVNQSSGARWEWHYNSHAVNCELITGNNLSCWVVNSTLPSEVWAEFFPNASYEGTFKSNMINL